MLSLIRNLQWKLQWLSCQARSPGSLLYGFRPPRLCSEHTRNAHTDIAERGHGRSHSVDKGPVSQRPPPARHVPFRLARGAIHQSAYLLAHVGNFIVGVLLSLEMFCNLGSGLLLFGG